MTPRLYFADCDLLLEVDDLHEAIGRGWRWGAGRDWWLFAAWTPPEAAEIADLLLCTMHPRQAEFDDLHAEIRAGGSPDLAPLYADLR